MRERESSAAAACCALPVCCMLCAVSCSTAALSHCTYALFILCSSIFSTLLQAPVNCWTDFFSFLPWIRHIFLAAKIKINFFGVCGREFSKNSSAVGSGKEGKGVHIAVTPFVQKSMEDGRGSIRSYTETFFNGILHHIIPHLIIVLRLSQILEVPMQ